MRRRPGMEAKDYVVQARSRMAALEMSCEDPDAPQNWPRNMFVWRSNLLGSSRARGTSISASTCWAPTHGVQGKDLGQDDAKPAEVKSGTTRTRRKASSTCW